MCRQADTDISERSTGSMGRRPVLLVLAMMAVGGWFAEAKAAEDAPEEGGAGYEEGGGGPEYVDLEWFMVQARQSDGRRRNLSLLLTLEVAAGGDIEAVAGNKRQLRDAYLLALSSPPLVQSGGIVKGKLDGEAAMVHTTLGDGHFVLFAWNPMHRHITQHDHALVYNALMFWNDLERPVATEDASP